MNYVNSYVICLSEPYENIVFQGVREAERATGVDNSNISKVCKGIRKSAGGLEFQYFNPLVHTDYKYFDDFDKKKQKSLAIKSMEGEIWKDIKGYEGKYLISNLGRVKSVIGNEKLLKPHNKNTKDMTSYLKIALSKGHKPKAYLIHRLVAQAFIPNPDNLPEVNHKDENKLNNRADNLEWCTRKYNVEYSRARHPDSFNDYGIKVYCLDLDEYFESASKASAQTGVCRTSILKACRGQQDSAGGMLWCYAKDKDKKFPS